MQCGRMAIEPRKIVRLLVKAGLGLLVANEVRGIILAGPVLYGMYEAGGTAMAIWLRRPIIDWRVFPRSG